MPVGYIYGGESVASSFSSHDPIADCCTNHEDYVRWGIESEILARFRHVSLPIPTGGSVGTAGAVDGLSASFGGNRLKELGIVGATSIRGRLF